MITRLEHFTPENATGRWFWQREFVRRFGPASVSASLAVLLYAVTLAGSYVYDDEFIARDDERVRDAHGWVDYLRTPYFPAAPDPLWRPLTSMTYAAHWQLHGERAWPLHAVNIFLHACASAMVALLAGRWTARTAISCIAGVLFAAHPIHVEAVAYIVGRAEILCTLGVLAGLILFTRCPFTVPAALGITVCFAFAVLSKEHGLLLAPMLLICFLANRFVRGPQLPIASVERQAMVWLFVFLSGSILAYIAYRESIMHLAWERFFMRWTVNPLFRSRGMDRALLPFSILGRYAGLLLVPLKLSPDYGAEVIGFRVDWNDPFLYLGFCAALLWLVAVAVAVGRHNAVAVICLFCMAVAYGLISNSVYLIGTVMGERLAYLLSVFFVIPAAIVLARLPRRALTLVLPLIVILASLRTVTYAWRWNDALRLFSLSRREQPRSIYLHVLEAEERMVRGDLDEAERILGAARVLGPESQNVWALSRELAVRRGHPEEARPYAVRAFDLNLHPPHMESSHSSGPGRPATAPSR